MPRTETVGERVQELRRERGLSAQALSKRAGLGINYVRQLERGGGHPDPQKLEAVARALDLDGPAITELRRLAGIDPDPGATREAKAARRDAWPLLTYILTSHLLLPRLELGQVLSQKDRRAPSVAHVLRAAAEADNLFTYCRATDPTAKPPRALAVMLEGTFDHLDVDAVRRLQRNVKLAGDAWQSEQSAHLLHPRTVGDRELVVRPLLKFRSPDTTEIHALLRVERSHFNAVFAVRLFPLIYYDACRFWPFSKVFMPDACYGESAQKQLCDLARHGISIDDFDDALLRPGALTLAGRQREPCDIDKLFFRAPPLVSWRRDDGRTSSIPSSLPSQLDRVFDHLDRSAFLDRFPLIKLVPEQFGQLAASHELPSWRLLRDHLLRHHDVPVDVLDQQPLAHPLPPGPFTEGRPESFIVRLITDALRERGDELADRDQWPVILKAAGPLQLNQGLIDLIRDLCAARSKTTTNADRQTDPLHPGAN